MTDGCIRTAIPLHRHGEGTFELHVILAGQGAVRTRGGEKSVRAGDFFITPGGLEHEQTSLADDPVRELCVYAVQTPPADEKLLQDGMLWMGSAGEEMLFCARQAARELCTARTDGGEILSCYFRLMLLYAERSRGKGADCGAQVGDGSIFLRIDDAFLYDHASITLPELADRVGLSERQLQRVLRERYGNTGKSRIEICAKGYTFDNDWLFNIDKNFLWIYVKCQAVMRILHDMEPDSKIKAAYYSGLCANAESAYKSAQEYKLYDNSANYLFNSSDWRKIYKWRPQESQKDAEKLALEQLKSHSHGAARKMERNYMTNPMSAVSMLAFSGEAKYRKIIEDAISHYDYSKFHLGEIIYASIAYSALKTYVGNR